MSEMPEKIWAWKEWEDSRQVNFSPYWTDVPEKETQYIRTDLYDALAAQLKEATEPRPIATAPKDGTWILATMPPNENYPLWFAVHWDRNEWRDEENCVATGSLTHWLPMPKSPGGEK